MFRSSLLALALGSGVVAATTPPGLPSDFQAELNALLVHDLKFSPADLDDLERGKIVRHTLPPSDPGELSAVGAVRISANKERLAAAYRDIVHFKRNANVLEIGRFSKPPEPSDLDALTITKDDLDLRNCRVGDCGIRLPADGIHRFEKEIDWRRADADARAASMFKQMLIDNVRSYTSGGPGRITQYDDDSAPITPVRDFHAILKSSPYLDVALPGLRAHLEAFPVEPLPGAEDFLYWSKEKFGFAPFISVTHVTIVPEGPHESIATTRDVYSSRYFDASLALAIASDSARDPNAFYLVYVNRSRASALRGAFAKIRRSIAERRVRASLEDNLRDVKQRLELSSN
jgi:hypothetical protein